MFHKKYITPTEIAKNFNTTAKEINIIFKELGWATKEERWWIATPLGIEHGANQKYNTKNKQKYIVWDEAVLQSFQLKNAIQYYQSNYKPKIENSIIQTKAVSKKKKGDNYELYVANFFKEKGYYVWEHGKEKGIKDNSIDLFVKKERFIYFVQCKDWKKWKISHKEVKATRTDLREYLKARPEFWNLIKSSKLKLLYVTSQECLTKGAYTYIEENKELIEYQVIEVK